MPSPACRAAAALLLTIAAASACQRDAARAPERAVVDREVGEPVPEAPPGEVQPPARPVDPDADLVVVVGERLSLYSIDTPDSLGGLYRVHYRVLQRLHGRDDGPQVAFETYEHLGEPRQLGYTHALLFLRRDGANLVEVADYPVFAARGGGWAGCAPEFEMDARRRATGPARAVAGIFAGEASYEVLLPAQPGVRDLKDFKVDGRRVRCLTGTPVQALYELNKDILATGTTPRALAPEQIPLLKVDEAPPAAGRTGG